MQKAAYAYLATQVTTTDQGDLLLLLYEGAIKFLKQAKTKMEERDFAQKGMLISKALDVIAELDSSLNVDKGGELAQNLHNLYFYCNTRLLQANLRMNVAQVDEVIRILEALKEAFNQISKSKFLTKAAEVHAPAGGNAPADGGKPQMFSIGKNSGPAPAAHVLAATAQAQAAPQAYKAAAKPAPLAALRKPAPAAAPAPAPAASAPRPPAAQAPPPQAPAAKAPEPPAARPEFAPTPQPETPPADPDLARVKALHRAYGRYGNT